MPKSQSRSAAAPPAATETGRSLSLHQKVTDALRARIHDGTLLEGTRLPSERVLSDEFQVSRVTVRQALKDLENEGLVEAGGGLRWVARRAAVTQSLEEGATGLVSFADLGGIRGLAVRANVLVSASRPSSLDEAEALGVAPGANVHELVRLRFLDDVPVVVDHSLIPTALAPDLGTVDFRTASLYQTLATRYGCHALRAEYAMEARAADPEHAGLLGLTPGDPVLEAWQTTFDEHGRVIQLCRLVYRGDRYRFRTLLERGHSSAELSRRTPAESVALGNSFVNANRGHQ